MANLYEAENKKLEAKIKKKDYKKHWSKNGKI
jgi:hypothetical protein